MTRQIEPCAKIMVANETRVSPVIDYDIRSCENSAPIIDCDDIQSRNNAVKAASLDKIIIA